MLIVHLFVSCAHVNLCHFFSSSWCRGLAAASACGSSSTFLFTFSKRNRVRPIKIRNEILKSNENIHKNEGGSYYVVSANKASSVTL